MKIFYFENTEIAQDVVDVKTGKVLQYKWTALFGEDEDSARGEMYPKNKWLLIAVHQLSEFWS